MRRGFSQATPKEARVFEGYSEHKNLISELTTLKRDIRIIGASKYSGQAKVIARLRTMGFKSSPNIAIILADETLLNPILSVLPPHPIK